MILMTGGDRILAEDLGHEQLTWLEKVWLEVQDEIAYEANP